MAEPPTRNWSQRLHGTDEFRQTWVLESEAETRLVEAERQRDEALRALQAAQEALDETLLLSGVDVPKRQKDLPRPEDVLGILRVDVPKGPPVIPLTPEIVADQPRTPAGDEWLRHHGYDPETGYPVDVPKGPE